MAGQTQQQQQCTTLSEIQRRKAELLQEIRNDNKEISTLWHEIFNKPDAVRKKGFSMSGIMTTGAGVVDGLLFAWKLYKRLKK